MDGTGWHIIGGRIQYMLSNFIFFKQLSDTSGHQWSIKNYMLEVTCRCFSFACKVQNSWIETPTNCNQHRSLVHDQWKQQNWGKHHSQKMKDPAENNFCSCTRSRAAQTHTMQNAILTAWFCLTQYLTWKWSTVRYHQMLAGWRQPAGACLNMRRSNQINNTGNRSVKSGKGNVFSKSTTWCLCVFTVTPGFKFLRRGHDLIWKCLCKNMDNQ